MSERTKFRLLSGQDKRYGETPVEDFLHGGWARQKREKTRAEVARMRDRLSRVESSARERRKRAAISQSDVDQMLSNLESVKANTRRFLKAQAGRSLRDEAAKNHQQNAAKLFQAAAAGDEAACEEVLRLESETARRLARIEGEGEGSTSAAALAAAAAAGASTLVNAADIEGRRPLHYAACHGGAEVVSRLLEAGAEADAVDRDGYTALHYACRWDRPAAVDVLVWRVGINARDQWGQTALHVAAASGACRLVNVLVMRGVAVGQEDRDGRTAVEVALDQRGRADDGSPEEFAAAVRLATEAPRGELAFGPAEFDIVRETQSLTDERELTAQIISEVYQLSDDTASAALDAAVSRLETMAAAPAAAARLGQPAGARAGLSEQQALEGQLRADAAAYGTLDMTDYDALARIIAPAS